MTNFNLGSHEADEAPAAGNWLELSLIAAVEAADAISEVFRANDVRGVAVEALLTPGADEGLAHREDRVRIVAYLPLDEETAGREQRIREGLWHLSAFDLAPMSEPSRKILQEEDWANSWKEHFHPIRIGWRFVVKPSWHTFDAGPDDLVIQLDPGMAFGTGLHPTTRMMLEAIEGAMTAPARSILEEEPPVSRQLRTPEEPPGANGIAHEGADLSATGSRVFDVGTGSGILAIGAVLLGAGAIDAVDVESIACRVTRENAALNGVLERITISRGSIEQGTGKYDVILANIVSSVLVDIASAFRPLMHQDTRVFISGVIDAHADGVNEAFAHAGLEVINVMRTGDWLCEELRLSGR
jgi:ribosomal protein L11 methyltransferase